MQPGDLAVLLTADSGTAGSRTTVPRRARRPRRR